MHVVRDGDRRPVDDAVHDNKLILASFIPAMARLRRDTQDSAGMTLQRPLRVVASGTLFLTNNLALPTHPEPNSVVRAHSVLRVRGGSASTCMSIAAQFPAVEAMLVAPLGGNDEGRMIINELEQERVSTRFCKVWQEAGVPSAWVLQAGEPEFWRTIGTRDIGAYMRSLVSFS